MILHRTKIPYATHAANWQAGCSHVSVGCDHCWAERMSVRLAANPCAPTRYKYVIEAGHWNGKTWYYPTALAAAFLAIASLRKPAVIFLGDMTDLFHEKASSLALDDLAHALHFAPPRHRYLLVTKRPARLLAWQREHFPDGLPPWVWVLCSVCCQADADRMLPDFLQVKGQKGIHAEPLLGAVDFSPWLFDECCGRGEWSGDPNEPPACCCNPNKRLPFGFLATGPENGPHARPCNLDWIRSLRDQAVAANVAFFLKSGLPLDGVEWQQTPWSPHA